MTTTITQRWYALINPDDEIIREEFSIDPTVETKPGYRWIPIEVESPPKYDQNTSVSEGPNLRLETDKVVKYWTIREKTAMEIQNEVDSKINSIDPMILKIMHQQHKMITSNNEITFDEYKVYLRSLV